MKYGWLLVCFLFSFHVNGQSLYEYNWRKEAVIIGGSGLMGGISLYIDSRRPTLVVPPLGSALPVVNRLDKGALDNYSLTAKSNSDILFYGATFAPFAMLLSNNLKGSRAVYALMYGEVIALNGGFTFLVKSVSDRKRPLFYNEEVPIEERQSLDSRKAFFSGHTSHTAALSFFTASVFSDIHPDSKWKTLVWAGAISIPAVTGYLRVRAGKHFTSDVLVGYGVGAGIGLLIPQIHKNHKFGDLNLRIAPEANGFYARLDF